MLSFKDPRIKLIGIGGMARSGKDSLGDAIIAKLSQNKEIVVIKESFAFCLREELKDIVRDYFDIDVYTQQDAPKTLLRPILTHWTDLHRKQTQGTYFWSKTKERIENLIKIYPDGKQFIILLSDLRFAEYENDEIDFINANGLSIHLSKSKNGVPIEPPNDFEAKNDPILKKMSKIQISWEHFGENKEGFSAELDKYSDLVIKELAKNV